MNALTLAVAVLLFTVLAPANAQDGPPAGPAYRPDETVQNIPGYKLVWNDEFDVDGAPDAEKWNFEHGFCRNRETQWYQPDNATCRGGLLVIEGRQEQVENPNYEAGSGDRKKARKQAAWTSSSLNTWGKSAWPLSSCIITVRARLSPQPGYFPAIWTTGPSEWPFGGEVDLMECYGGRILANFAWGTKRRWNAHWHPYDNPNHGDKNKPRISWFTDRDPEFLQKFHVWKLVGTDEQVQLFLDDELLNEVTQEQARNPEQEWSKVVFPFRQPHALILNLAIGGPGGDPSSATSPMIYEVDYARVYQAEADE